MYVYRDGKRVEETAPLVAELAERIAGLEGDDGAARARAATGALIRAGELEAIAGDEAAQGARVVAELTDALATVVVGGARCSVTADRAAVALAGALPRAARVGPQEGFAFYALHPLDFADLARTVPLGGARAGVVGIRSIGTTLSAVVAAALRARGVATDRITVRPTGHPYDREVRLDDEARAWARAIAARGGDLYVVDEGPGMSGSSLLGAADALSAAGVSAERIAILHSRPVDPARLVARDAARRWTGYRSYCVSRQRRVPAEAVTCLDGGRWRALAFRSEREWPAVWAQCERLKYLSRCGRRLLKFEGLGRYGELAMARARALADAGFSPEARDEGEGYASTAREGAPLAREDVSRDVLARLAEYCAARAALFPLSDADPSFASMLEVNARALLGRDVDAAHTPRVARPILADGRMQPYEWLRTEGGALLKVDATSHGDDHFFPGPTDVAWDLAGAIVEWDLAGDAREAFVSEYARRSGDHDVDARLPAWIFAYALFRAAYTNMAAAAVEGSTEEPRLVAEHARYRAIAEGALR